MEAVGRHILLELYECDSSILNNVEVVEAIMREAAQKAGATILGGTFHKFDPHGVTGILAIAESHLSVHTWPEYEYAAVDVFICGDQVNPEVSCLCIIKGFKAQKKTLFEMKRGMMFSTP